jgi:hypothetical protein
MAERHRETHRAFERQIMIGLNGGPHSMRLGSEGAGHCGERVEGIA